MVWVARYTGRDGKRRVAKPSWNRGKGTFIRKSEAQRAIDKAYEIAATPHTFGEYFATWIERHPRSERTNATYEHMLANEGRATTGAIGILRSLSAMAEDALTDEVCDQRSARASMARDG